MADNEFDLHQKPHFDVTPGQMTFLSIWIGCICIWLYRGAWFHPTHDNGANETKNQSLNGTAKCVNDNEIERETKVEIEKETKEILESKTKTVRPNTAGPVPPTLDMILGRSVIFGAIMVYFYLCDYRKIFPMVERVYDRDTFLFLVFLLFLVACAFTIKPTPDKIVNRDQTEEWKGWMQVMFVWYHVFAATEWYNWIRVYIAAYVWMTGFGNFSFFWVRQDFSLWRFLKMQFRLNFLVTCLCVVTSNQYMLYYICAMHSYWFVSVYVFMRVFSSWNTDRIKMAAKFACYFLFNFLVFEIPVIRDNIFKPFWFILQYNDPRFDDRMHEWIFRAGLDHWACFVGMVCAYNYPHFEAFMQYLESKDNYRRKMLTKFTMMGCSILALFLWYTLFMVRDKYSYNPTHPYTSMIPIICFIIIRNAFPFLRQYYVEMFAFLGKITLETYLSQLHIYLQSNAKHLIGYIPQYSLLNFALSTVIYLPISYMLFNLTTDFSAYLIPKDTEKLDLPHTSESCVGAFTTQRDTRNYVSPCRERTNTRLVWWGKFEICWDCTWINHFQEHEQWLL